MATQIAGLVASRSHGFLFIHIPKTAGGSLKRALLAQCPDAVSPEIGAQGLQRAVGVPLPTAVKNMIARSVQYGPLRFLVTTTGHPTAALIFLAHPKFHAYRKFAFVRNPFDRIVSAYEYARQQERYDEEFSCFVEDCPRRLQPQVNFVFFYRKLMVDWIGRFERLEEDVESLRGWLGLPELMLPHRNKTVRTRYEDYLTPSLKRRIIDVYGADFAAFDYAHA